MKVKDKQELVRLLHLYMDDLVKDNDYNKQRVKEVNKWACTDLKCGVKAQYEHARIIDTKLSVEIGKDLKSIWEL